MRNSPALSISWEQRLARGPQGEVWHVRRPDGTPMVAKQISATTVTQRARLWKLVRRGRTLGTPLVPFVDAVVGSNGVWLLRDFDPGVALPGLVALAPLSRRQAAATAAGCLVALSRLHGAGILHGRMHAGNVFVEPDGSVHVLDAGLNATLAGRHRQVEPTSDMLAAASLICRVWPGFRADRSSGLRDLFEAAQSGDAAAACAGLEMLAAAVPESAQQRSPDLALGAVGARLLTAEPAKRPVPPRTPAPERKPVPPRTPAPPPDVGAEPIPAASLPGPADVGSREPAHRRELPSLADAAWARASGLVAEGRHSLRSAAKHWRGVLRAPGGPLESRRRAADGGRRLQRTQAGHAAAASVAIAATLGAAHVVAHPAPRLAQVGPHTQEARPQPAPQSAAPAPGAAVLQPAAASSAGFVRAVELVPLGTCGAGNACALKSVLELQAPHESAGVAWDVIAVDRCTGAQSVLKTSSQPLDSSWNLVWATDEYELPSTHPTLLYAVTVTPWRVASAPVATTGTCGGGR